MLLLVNNIMDCYRLDADGESFDCVQLDLNDLLTKCLTEMKPLAEEAQISMTLAISGSGKALADKFAMHRVLCNLIGNAIKFTPKGGRIDVAAYERDAKAIIAVKDTGCGMTSADQESVFRRFFQAKRSYRSKGLGLGLYICQKLLEGQKGSIKCESVLGEGTTFEIALPLCEKEDEQPSVLVVDDSQLARTFAENVLRSLSIQTDSVSDGSAALLAAQKKNYNAILLDLMMPEMDGYATSKALRSLGVKTPILACSGSQVSEAESLTQAGCDAFILKPVTRENFKSVYSKFTASAL
jgi:CheY-like chemotaxis protein